MSKRRILALVKLGANKEQAKAIAYSRKSYWNTSMYISIYITNARLKEKAKRTAYSRASYWHNSMSIVLQVAISNERLKRKGLVMPLDHYLKVHTLI